MIREAFNRAGAKPEGSSNIDFLEAILLERPDLAGQTAYFPGQGQKGHVVIIGNEVFKGPQRLKGEPRNDFETECKYLREMEGKGLPVPTITTVGKDFIFIGMTKAPGVLMGGGFEHDLTTEQQEQLAKDLIGFVISMAHALPTQGGKYAMHDDLWYNNIFIDPETKRLSGVIDFGKVVHKKASDWKPMFDFDGTDFSDMLRREFDNRKAELPEENTLQRVLRTTSAILR